MMKSDDLEARLSRVPRRGPPPAWRDQILAGAAAESVALSTHARTHARTPRRGPAVGSCWGWVGGGRWALAWSILATGWVAIVALQALTPRSESGTARTAVVHGSRVPMGIPDAFAGPSQRRLLVQLLGEEGFVPAAARPRREQPAPPPPRGDRPGDGFGHRLPSSRPLPSSLA